MRLLCTRRHEDGRFTLYYKAGKETKTKELTSRDEAEADRMAKNMNYQSVLDNWNRRAKYVTKVHADGGDHILVEFECGDSWSGQHGSFRTFLKRDDAIISDEMMAKYEDLGPKRDKPNIEDRECVRRRAERKCTCGVQAAGCGGKHSSWCDIV